MIEVSFRTEVPNRPARLASVDIARGIAVIGMFGYHLTWDLAHFAFIDPAVPFSPAFRAYSHVVACAFLGLAGISLRLAQREPFRWPAWGRQVLRIALAALAVTAASYVFAPEAIIEFGILHCIALSLVVATPFLFLPPSCALLAAAAVACIALLHWPAMNAPALIWTGLGTVEPTSNDFRPIFPWLAPVLAGVGLAGLFDILHLVASTPPGNGRIPRTLAWGGRHSLAIYLLHQPLFFGALAGLATVLPQGSRSETAYLRSCEASCERVNANRALCRNVCGCVLRGVQNLHLWERVSKDALGSAEKRIIANVAQRCLREVSPE